MTYEQLSKKFSALQSKEEKLRVALAQCQDSLAEAQSTLADNKKEIRALNKTIKQQTVQLAELQAEVEHSNNQEAPVAKSISRGSKRPPPSPAEVSCNKCPKLEDQINSLKQARQEKAEEAATVTLELKSQIAELKSQLVVTQSTAAHQVAAKEFEYKLEMQKLQHQELAFRSAVEKLSQANAGLIEEAKRSEAKYIPEKSLAGTEAANQVYKSCFATLLENNSRNGR